MDNKEQAITALVTSGILVILGGCVAQAGGWYIAYSGWLVAAVAAAMGFFLWRGK